MKFRLEYLIVCLVCLLAQPAIAEVKLPVVEILGRTYYVYESKKDDTMFGIARKFKWNDATLRNLNPKVMSPLEKGTNIYYPVSDEGNVSVTVDVSAESQKPVKHLIKKGETVYSISQLYGVSVDRIYALNPSSREGIKAGDVLSIREAGGQPYVGENPEYYTVRKGDTLYKVARTYNTTVAAIMKLNPGISEKNFQADAVIKLPSNGTGLKQTVTQVEETRVTGFRPYKVKKDDTWQTIASKNGVSKEQLIAVNKGVSKLRKNEIIGIPELITVTVEKTTTEEDPREQSSEGLSEIYADVHDIVADSAENIVSAVLLLSEPSARKDLDFSRGFLTGVDRMKHRKFRIKVNVIDGTKPFGEIASKLDEIEPSIVFLTTDKDIPDSLALYAREEQVPMVNTFDVRSEEYTRNPYFIQLLTPSSYFNDEIASYVKNNYANHYLVFVGEQDANDQLAASLSEGREGRMSRLPSLEPDPLSSFAFDPEGKYIIYGSDTRKADVQKLLAGVRRLREENPFAEFVLVGRPNWIMFDESMAEQLHAADAMIPSRFYYDKDSTDGRRFAMYYKSVFDMTPVKSFPSYAAMGYDSALYFIPMMGETGGDLNQLRPSSDTVQSDFELKRLSNWSGLMNPVVYLVRFTPYDTIEKIKVK